MKINKVSQISSKAGDKGTSRSFSNESYKKNDILFEVLGTMDELSSYLGLIYHFVKFDRIKIIQKQIQNINSKLATSVESDLYKKLQFITDQDVESLETEMQAMLDKHPIEPRFYLPGSEKTRNGAYFDYARTIARKAERRLTEFVDRHDRKDLQREEKYLNRLSDYLFVLSLNI